MSYDAFFEAIEARLGDRFRAQNIGPARLFGYAWMETGEKEYTYMSLTNKYVPFFDIFRAIFYRVLGQAGVAHPRSFATDDDREFLLAAYRTLRPRPGLLECFETLRAAGYTVWALTSGDTARVAGYLEAAGAKFPEENFVSCDSIGIGKPAPSAYQFILDKFPKENLDLWFAAAHIWDAAAARQCGYVFAHDKAEMTKTLLTPRQQLQRRVGVRLGRRAVARDLRRDGGDGRQSDGTGRQHHFVCWQAVMSLQ